MNAHQKVNGIVNQLNLGAKLREARGRAFSYLVNQMLLMTSDKEAPREETWEQKTLRRMTDVGPAASSAAVEKTLLVLRGSGTLTNNACESSDFVENVRQLAKQPAATQEQFTTNFERTLIPGLTATNFDAMVDPKHMVDRECGHPPIITPAMYRYMYDRDETAGRVVDIYPDETAAHELDIYEVPEEDRITPFEEDLKNLLEDPRILLPNNVYRADKLCGVGRFGILLFGFDDGLDLSQPVKGLDARTGERLETWQPLGLNYVRPFDEYLVCVDTYDTDTRSPRFGLPTQYNVVFVDSSVDFNTVSFGTRTNTKVHWTRVVHLAEHLRSSPILAVPRQERPFNRLLGLRKIYGGSAEMLWLGGYPGLAFEINPDLAGDDLEYDADSVKAEMEAYVQGQQRFLRMAGGTVKTLASSIADPDPHVRIHLGAISMHCRVPLRIFLGSEEARLASEQDKLNWNSRLAGRMKDFNKPRLWRPVVDLLIRTGVVRSPKDGKYTIDLPDLNSPTNEDKANLALKWSQAISQYVASGMIHLIPPTDFFTIILGLNPRDAVRLAKQLTPQMLAKLKKVDPSQGSGVNGKRENVASTKGDASKGRKKVRRTADKSIEGRTG